MKRETKLSPTLGIKSRTIQIQVELQKVIQQVSTAGNVYPRHAICK